jgi:hypothetical protein
MLIKHLLRLILAILMILIIIYIFRTTYFYNLLPFIYTVIKLSSVQFLLILFSTVLSLLFNTPDHLYFMDEDDFNNHLLDGDYPTLSSDHKNKLTSIHYSDSLDLENRLLFEEEEPIPTFDILDNHFLMKKTHLIFTI